MEIVLIGTGNTATVLGKKLKAAGHVIMQVYGRTESKARLLAKELSAEVITAYQDIGPQADLVLLAVSDRAVAEVASQLPATNAIVAHTAGSLPKEILGSVAENHGVFYPLQSLKKELAQLPAIPLLVDASNEETKNKLMALAHSISGEVSVAGNEQRLKMHLAAVVVNNFSNHLFALVENFCKTEGLHFSLLLPLIKETVLRLDQISPAQSQTGPAVRNDMATIEKHLSLLQTYPPLEKLYTLFTDSIRQKNPG